MKKAFCIIVIFLCAGWFFTVHCRAAENEELYDTYYHTAFDLIDEDTKELLEAAGVDEGGYAALMGLSPQGIFGMLKELFADNVGAFRVIFADCLIVLILVRFFSSFFSSEGVASGLERLGGMLLLFLLISACAQAGDVCVRAVQATNVFMRSLIPLYASVVAFSGNPAAAVSTNTLVFTFAQGVSAFFGRMILPLIALGSAFGAAGVLSPVQGIQKIAVLINRAFTWGIALVAGVFSSVLSIRGVLSGATDTVSRRGIRFVIGGAIPVVGSAVSEAFASLVSGLEIIKSSVGVLALLTVVFINLPALACVIVWKLLLYLISAAAQMFEMNRLTGFTDVLKGSFGAVTAVVCFNCVVYTVALALLVLLKAN